MGTCPFCLREAAAAHPVAAVKFRGRSNGRWGMGKEENSRGCIIAICTALMLLSVQLPLRQGRSYIASHSVRGADG